MNVVLLHNVRETANLSMKLYAERIASVLDGCCQVRHVYPWSIPAWPRLGVIVKGMDYLVRYALYPASLLRRRGDVFHIVDHAYAHLLVCLPARHTVVTCHDLMLVKLARGEFGARAPVPRVAAWLFRASVRFLRRAACVIADSRSTADDLVRHLEVPREQIRVVYPGVDPTFSPPPDPGARTAARDRYGFGDRPVILHVGNNWFYKNLEGLLRAFALLAGGNGRRGPLFVKVGKALSPGQRVLARALGVEDRVRELGVLSPEELRAIYWSADVLAFPSFWEGFGWPVLEAMASGTPVVCSDRGALGEVAGEAAALIGPDDPRDIAQAIERILDDEGFRSRLVRSGLARAREFTWERAGEELYQIYQAVSEGAGE